VFVLQDPFLGMRHSSQVDVQSILLDPTLRLVATKAIEPTRVWLVIETCLALFSFPGPRANQRKCIDELVADEGCGREQRVDVDAIIGEKTWQGDDILNPLTEDMVPGPVTGAKTWVMSAMDFCLLYLAHRKHEFQPRALVALLGMMAKISEDHGVQLPDEGLDAALRADARDQAAAALPAFTERSGVYRPKWTLWTTPGYFSESAIHKVRNLKCRFCKDFYLFFLPVMK
jgi:hypothetical protein